MESNVRVLVKFDCKQLKLNAIKKLYKNNVNSLNDEVNRSPQSIWINNNKINPKNYKLNSQRDRHTSQSFLLVCSFCRQPKFAVKMKGNKIKRKKTSMLY